MSRRNVRRDVLDALASLSSDSNAHFDDHRSAWAFLQGYLSGYTGSATICHDPELYAAFERVNEAIKQRAVLPGKKP